MNKKSASGNDDSNGTTGATAVAEGTSVSAAGEAFDFPAEELKILDWWDKIDAFATSLKLSQERPRYTFLDGPPFATGLPHYGHLLAGTIKDTVLRYAALTGHHVERRFGWDCHGLPVEYEIDKKLDIKSKEDVLRMGIAAYNAECRAIVMRYSGEWESTVRRMARWIDFRNDYKTMYPSFMESVWWVFKELFDKGQIYRGFRVMPYSTACSTPLSNFEVALNYKDSQDPSVILEMPLLEGDTNNGGGSSSTSLLIWTTTPWTLPSNLAICAHPELTYVYVQSALTDRTYVIAEARLAEVMEAAGHKSGQYTVVKSVKGAELEGLRYAPLFDFFQERLTRYPRTFSVVTDTYVTSDTGTGLVHQAPAFGEDDFNVCLRYGITSETDVPCPIDDAGRFMPLISSYQGQFWRDANSIILRDLEAKGRLFHRTQLTHSYPFCWRSDTPLIYRTIPCWFVRVQNIIPQLLEASAQSRWVPDFVQEKRFHNWLMGARDWAISRNRYWGTPIPIWASEDGQEVVCVGSVEELERLSGATGIKDLHRESIDHIVIPSQRGKGELRRVEEVLDCWFESGSVPYATEHYPFEHKERFETNFPADFIGEGLDQTRGWFYTLTVLGVHLFGKVPFKNLIVNGLVLAADGKKMSKRLKNYPEPKIMFDSYGADALRLYLINSPVVRAEPLRFREDGVRNIIRDVLLPWLNAYRFLATQLEAIEAERGKGSFTYDPSVSLNLSSLNTMDAWILASLQTLIKTVKDEMAEYKLYAVVPHLLRFIEALTNWYIRFNRRRLRGDAGSEEQHVSLTVLFDVIYNFCIIMAPFTPLFAENLYQRLRPHKRARESVVADDRSVHFLLYPQVRSQFFNEDMERAFGRLQQVVESVRTLRESRSLPLKTPLRELVVLTMEATFRSDLVSLESYILEELNVRSLRIVDDEAAWGVLYRATPNFKLLGARLKGDLPMVQKALAGLSQAQLCELQNKGKLLVAGHELSLEEVAVTRVVELPADSTYVTTCETAFIGLLDVTMDASLREEGLAREILNRIQRLRKRAGLKATDDVRVTCHVERDPEGDIRSTLDSQMDYLSKTLKSALTLDATQVKGEMLVSDVAEVGSGTVRLALSKF